jgi:hypothetical protein
MNPQSYDLASLQREMAAAVMLPLTADQEMQAKAVDGRSMHAVASTFIAPNSRLNPFERLEIYNQQYWLRVLGALAEDFPALRAVVGHRAFEALSIAYLTAHPSRSFTLRNLGSKLVEWLANNPAFTGRHYRLALDVARIEWAYVEAFDSAEWTPLTLDQVTTLDANSRLALQPHLQLLALDYAADEIVLDLHDREKRGRSEAGVLRDEAPQPPVKLPKLRRRPTWIAAHRVDLTVYYRRLEAAEFHTLAAIRDGMPLAEALESGLQPRFGSRAPKPQKVQEWFANWAELGWICAPPLDSSVLKEEK